jgi:hypothetical protein
MIKTIKNYRDNITHTDKKKFSALMLNGFLLCTIYALHSFLYRLPSEDMMKPQAISAIQLIYEILCVGSLSIVFAILYCLMNSYHKKQFISLVELFTRTVEKLMMIGVIVFAFSMKNLTLLKRARLLKLLILALSGNYFYLQRINLFNYFEKKKVSSNQKDDNNINVQNKEKEDEDILNLTETYQQENQETEIYQSEDQEF